MSRTKDYYFDQINALAEHMVNDYQYAQYVLEREQWELDQINGELQIIAQEQKEQNAVDSFPK